MGIKNLKKGYNPQPYCRKNAQGKKVAYNDRANTAAQFLADKIWGSTAKTKARMAAYSAFPWNIPALLRRVDQLKCPRIE